MRSQLLKKSRVPLILLLCLIVAWALGRRHPARAAAEKPAAMEWATALVAAVFLREIPLRKRQASTTKAAEESPLVESGKELAIEGLTIPSSPADGQSQPRLGVAPPVRHAGGD